jgi:predicted metal-dependent hydrolase
MPESPQRRPEGLQVRFRRMVFPFEKTGFERYWHGGSPFKSLFWTQLSTSFGPGEQFFIDSARALKGVVQDEALLAELTEFCKQEGHHTLQHAKFDRMNAALGVDVERCRKRYAFLLKRARARLNPLEMLAVTVALEHLTAGFAQVFFESPEFSAGADPNVTALWAWHAAEETEHKATCFDVYTAAGGGYFMRARTLPVAWTFILMLSLLNTFDLLQRDGKLWSFDTLRGLVYLFGPRGFITKLLPALIDFLRPGFHPWQVDNARQVEAWLNDNANLIAPVAKAS